jgi:predicted permease
MTAWVRRLASRLSYALSRAQADRDFDEEVQVHMALLVERFTNSGMSPEAARRAAYRQFGHRTTIENERMDLMRFVQIDAVWRDVRVGARRLRRNPRFTMLAVLLLALGIGANIAIFSVFDEVLLRPLPVRSPRDLALISVVVSPDATFQGSARLGFVSLREFLGPTVGIPLSVSESLRQSNPVFSDVLSTSSPTVVEFERQPGAPGETGSATFVTGNYFSVLGIEAAAGRVLSDSDASGTAVISHPAWRRLFGSDATVVGRVVRINGTPVEIIGVARTGFDGISVGSATDVWLPVRARESIAPGVNGPLTTLGRLKPGVSHTQAQEHVRALLPALRLGAALGFPNAGPTWFDLRVADGSAGASNLRDRYAEAIGLGMVASALVLLITCANLATLLLARSAAARQEIRVQLSIGAGRVGLVRQIFIEQLLLAGLGGIVGLIVAKWIAAFPIAALTGSTDALAGAEPSARILVFTALLSVAAAVVFGLLPAVRATRPDTNVSFNERSPVVAHVDRASRTLLIPVQVAVSMVLLVGALLFLQTLRNLEGLDVGFMRDQLLLVQFDLGRDGYRGTRLAAYADDVEQRLRAVPGVTSTTVVTLPPFGGTEAGTRIQIPGYTAAAGDAYFTSTNLVGPAFFATTGITVVHGRAFDSSDRNAASDIPNAELAGRVGVVNEAFARKYFQGQSAIGKEVLVARVPVEIIGIATDARYESLREEVAPMMYLPVAQDLSRWRRLAMLVRTSAPADIENLPRAVRQIVSDAGGGVRVARIESLGTLVDRTVVSERLAANLSMAGSALALLLVCVGLFGTVAYAVAQRSKEFGVRIALGARPGSIIRLVLGETIGSVVAGIAVGALLAFGAAQIVASRLFEVGPTDPLSLAMAAVLLLGVTVVAACAPTYRATKADPSVALRSE